MRGYNYWQRREAKRVAALRAREIRERNRLNLKSELARFWTHCNMLDMSHSERLARLQAFSEIIISEPERHARRFQRNRFVHGFCRRGKVCFGCGRWARIRHHIIQIQHGGSNAKENIVSLCAACHAEIHPWLKPELKPSVNNSPITPVPANSTEKPLSCSQLLTINSEKTSQGNPVPLNELVRPGDGY